MTNKTLKVSCENCGEVEVGAGDMAASVCTNAPHLGTYHFRCPTCHLWATRRALREALDMLERNGVHTTRWTVPAEVLEPHDGPVLTWDDVLDFAAALAGTDDLGEVAA